jgi:ABC-type antimicrobial peptide transport system permease subunit
MGVGALALGGLTLLLAMVGLFGIQSHIVASRTREIGVRMSFGASPGQIQRMILRSGSLPVLEGLAIGLLIGIAGRGILRYYMEFREMPIVDAWMLAVVPVPLILAGICACYLPARRQSIPTSRCGISKVRS